MPHLSLELTAGKWTSAWGDMLAPTYGLVTQRVTAETLTAGP